MFGGIMFVGIIMLLKYVWGHVRGSIDRNISDQSVFYYHMDTSRFQSLHKYTDIDPSQ